MRRPKPDQAPGRVRDTRERVENQLFWRIESTGLDVWRFIDGRLHPAGGSSIRLPEPLTKVLPPALRKRGYFAHATQKVLIRSVRRVQIDDLGYRDTGLVPSDQREGLARRDLAHLKDSKIETTPPAAQKALHHVRPAEANTKLEARHSRLRNHELGGPDPKAVPDANRAFQQAFRREVLAKRPPGEIEARQFLAPEGVVLRGVSIDGLLGPAMNGEIGLLIAFDV